ncbi:hypothetical protein WJX73_002915 [Symbiochloris irregularis]|uniref:Pre-mRNA-splicing factor 38 n=1 Tax=Symbiochloris irregularis TaxID=706552 RepID=A0AAW1NXV2_9CHLO
MANRTDPLARSIHGTNPQNLVEKILRMKIYSTTYWKERCFGLTAETLVDEAVNLKYVGGTYGGQNKPTEFICLALKLLQIQPDREIIVEFIKNEDYKYVRVLGAFYLRLVGKPIDVYQYLEPLYNDYRKLRSRNSDGNFSLTHMDEVVERLVKDDYLFDIALPRIPIRMTLETTGNLEPWVSALDEQFDEQAIEAEADHVAAQAAALEAAMKQEAEAEASKARDQALRDRERDWERDMDRDRDKHRDRGRDRDRSPDHRSSREAVPDVRLRFKDAGKDKSRDKDRHRDREKDRQGDRGRDRDLDRDRGRGRDREAALLGSLVIQHDLRPGLAQPEAFYG